ncbi:MAG: prepilin-type N-terminal cleavage/methylation domain-containing protein [Candidatus Moranbacteria bacterium]|nr:prepilin-type N-terminal cleavage/methylation domain-containing protein [Candidatus Moranbacteria bacterium]
MKKNKKIQTKKGFSLVEVLVSILVLSFGIVGISSLMMQNIKASVEAKNQIIAAELAQEGIELVRNMRDNNPSDFGTYFVYTGGGAEYIIDNGYTYADFKNSVNPTVDKEKLYIKSGYYGHGSNGAVSTKFYRKVNITKDDIKHNHNVTSYVTWGADPDASFADCNLANHCISTLSVLPL